MSDQSKSNASNTVDFKGDCGECSSGGPFSASCAGGMQPDQSATVNGNPPQNCVVGNDGATVYEIDLQRQAGFYSYTIRVSAKGPKGIGSGSFYLGFQDETNDVYHLSIYSSTQEWHEVSYNSSNPAIKTIYWSDHSFSVDAGDPNKAKPSFQVISPVNPEK